MDACAAALLGAPNSTPNVTVDMSGELISDPEPELTLHMARRQRQSEPMSSLARVPLLVVAPVLGLATGQLSGGGSGSASSAASGAAKATTNALSGAAAQGTTKTPAAP